MRAATAVSLFASIASAAYVIQDDYTPNKFASMFNFFDSNDPTKGYVNYVNQAQAQSSGYFKAQDNGVYIGVDSKNVATGRGRDSVRIESKAQYNHGLFILDLAHMPSGACGSWPAFWLFNPDWPNLGEIDIIEGVNSQGANSFAVHTNAGCAITNTGNFAGEMKTANCDVKAAGQPGNAGCAISSTDAQSYSSFNAVGGGVYATEWTSEAITMWFWPKGKVPKDVTDGVPNPEGWGLPSAQFKGACNIDKYIKNQQITFNVAFCGEWAGSVWGSDPICKAKAATCQDFVMKNPAAFKDTFWQINSLRVYSNNGRPAQPTSKTTATTVTVPTPITTQMTTMSTLSTKATTITAQTTPAAAPVGGSGSLPKPNTPATSAATTTTTSVAPTTTTTTSAAPTTTTTTPPAPIAPIITTTTTPAYVPAPAATTSVRNGGWRGYGDHKYGGWGA